MKKVYIAGSYSSDNIIQSLENIRRFMRMGTELILKKFVPLVPGFDHQFFFQLREGESISLEMIQSYSIELLKMADAVLVLKGFELSKGTEAELKVAYAMDKPVFYNLSDLLEWDAIIEQEPI